MSFVRTHWLRLVAVAVLAVALLGTSAATEASTPSEGSISFEGGGGDGSALLPTAAEAIACALKPAPISGTVAGVVELDFPIRDFIPLCENTFFVPHPANKILLRGTVGEPIATYPVSGEPTRILFDAERKRLFAEAQRVALGRKPFAKPANDVAEPSKSRTWYEDPIAIGTLLILAPPIGLAIVWSSKRYASDARWALTIMTGLTMFLVAAVFVALSSMGLRPIPG